ncbi:MAG: DegT/DnrJ/EryC1/StrS aminotransferase family protein [Desulfobacterales bacterium]
MSGQHDQQYPFIPHSRPTLGPEEMRAVADVISSGYIAEGVAVQEFENSFADYLSVGHAVATNSGTSALHLALLALEVGPGDEVIIPSYVCCALLNAVNYTGATPVLADICPETYNLAAADVKKRISDRTRAIIVPHLFGLAADLDSLMALDVPIIEDCAQAVGSQYAQRPVGTFGIAAIYSFFATKVITTGEGGMVVSNSKDIADRMRDLKTYDQKDEYKIRFNYKMTDIQAALGLGQLQRLDSAIRRRRAIAEQYTTAFKILSLNLPAQDPGRIFFRYVLDLDRDSVSFIQALANKSVGCNRPIFLPLHRQLKQKGCPASERAWKNSLSIPIYPSLTDEEVTIVIDAITSIF